ncbi:uncharacterized protein K460DRAFT_276357 [Cucurbitaria berberidis CBS 394.84]|uniref:Uncharacterized protein n=1 Tax=Cucurbitaria berberidis CBS 394.84 TaxID=1168544 RepID=A0A9P4LBF6_9PLEO|nr:uncharacterized protein K460DRAFT_276357 [Cucurbitaria berberidis CBS 394.84]KAF1848317.1 hypothetical protein K460DRAFT_276357 [Cucurbitaria berberidis CBS 394.84]
MCLVKSYETRGPGVLDPPPRRGNFTSQPPAGVMRLPREWRRSGSYSDDGRYVEYRRSQPRAIEYYEEPRRSTTRARSVSRRRVSDVELRTPRDSYVDERVTRRSVSRVRH